MFLIQKSSRAPRSAFTVTKKLFTAAVALLMLMWAMSPVFAQSPPIFAPNAEDTITFIGGEALLEPIRLPQATGGDAPLSYTLSPALPAGLAFNPSNRQITGTPPNVSLNLAYMYVATDGDTQVTLPLTLVINQRLHIMVDNIVNPAPAQTMRFPVTVAPASGEETVVGYTMLDPASAELACNAETFPANPGALSDGAVQLSDEADNNKYICLRATRSGAADAFQLVGPVGGIDQTPPTFIDPNADIGDLVFGVGDEVSLVLPKAGDLRPVTYSVTGLDSQDGVLIGLPNGLSFNAETRTLEGNLAADSRRSAKRYRYAVDDGLDNDAVIEFTISVLGAMSIELSGDYADATLASAKTLAAEITGDDLPASVTLAHFAQHAGAACDAENFAAAAAAGVVTETSGVTETIMLEDDAKNGKRYCLRAAAPGYRTAYLASEIITGLDTTPPVFSVENMIDRIFTLNLEIPLTDSDGGFTDLDALAVLPAAADAADMTYALIDESSGLPPAIAGLTLNAATRRFSGTPTEIFGNGRGKRMLWKAVDAAGNEARLAFYLSVRHAPTQSPAQPSAPEVTLNPIGGDGLPHVVTFPPNADWGSRNWAAPHYRLTILRGGESIFEERSENNTFMMEVPNHVLEPGDEYTFFFRWRWASYYGLSGRASGYSAFSEITTATVPTVPPVPTGLQLFLQPVDDENIHHAGDHVFTWDAASADEVPVYEVRYGLATLADNDLTPASQSPTSNFYALNRIVLGQANTEYRFQVRWRRAGDANPDNWSEWAGVTGRTPAANYTPPSNLPAPTNLQLLPIPQEHALDASQLAILTWERVPNALKYEIFTTANGESVGLRDDETPTNRLELRTLVPGTAHAVQVAASNPGSALSEPLVFTTHLAPVNDAGTHVVDNIIVRVSDVGGDFAHVNWNQVLGADTYALSVRDDNGEVAAAELQGVPAYVPDDAVSASPDVTANGVTLNFNARTAFVTGLRPNTEYTFVVTATLSTAEVPAASGDATDTTDNVGVRIALAAGTDPVLTEGATDAEGDLIRPQFMLQREEGAVSEDLVINVVLEATPGVLASGQPTMLQWVIPANANSTIQEVEIPDDDVNDSTGSLSVTVLPGEGYIVAEPSQATLKIRDDEVRVGLDLSFKHHTAEGGGETGAIRPAGEYAREVSRLNTDAVIAHLAPDVADTVVFVGAGAAFRHIPDETTLSSADLEGDPVDLDFSLSSIFPFSADASQLYALRILNDDVIEGREQIAYTFDYGISYALDSGGETIGGGAGDLSLGPIEAFVEDNDHADIQVLNVSALEGEDAKVNFRLRDGTRLKSAAFPIFVGWEIVFGDGDNAAVAADIGGALSGVTTIPAGNTGVLMHIPLAQDAVLEGANETFSVRITGINIRTSRGEVFRGYWNDEGTVYQNEPVLTGVGNTGVVTITEDHTPPAVSSVTLSTNNASGDHAAAGDEIKLIFNLSEPLQSAPDVFIGGQAAQVKSIGDAAYKAIWTVPDDAANGRVVYDIGELQDPAGNRFDPEPVLDPAETINIDTLAPVFPQTLPDLIWIRGAELSLALPLADDVSDLTYQLSGELPSGVTYSDTERQLSGIPTEMELAGVHPIWRATDAAGNTESFSFKVRVHPLRIAVTLYPNGQAGASDNMPAPADWAVAHIPSAQNCTANNFNAAGNVQTGMLEAERVDPQPGLSRCWRASVKAGTAIAYGRAGGTDRMPPVISDVQIGGDGANPAYAVVGDTIALLFTLSEAALSPPEVTLAGRPATLTSEGNAYRAMYRITAADADVITQGNLVYAIGAVIDLSDNSLAETSGMTDALRVDTTPPAPLSVAVSVKNRPDEDTAHRGEIVRITLTFDANESLTRAPALTIGAETIRSIADSSPNTFVAEWQVPMGVAAGELTYVVGEITDRAGNVFPASATPQASGVMLDPMLRDGAHLVDVTLLDNDNARAVDNINVPSTWHVVFTTESKCGAKAFALAEPGQIQVYTEDAEQAPGTNGRRCFRVVLDSTDETAYGALANSHPPEIVAITASHNRADGADEFVAAGDQVTLNFRVELESRADNQIIGENVRVAFAGNDEEVIATSDDNINFTAVYTLQADDPQGELDYTISAIVDRADNLLSPKTRTLANIRADTQPPTFDVTEFVAVWAQGELNRLTTLPAAVDVGAGLADSPYGFDATPEIAWLMHHADGALSGTPPVVGDQTLTLNAEDKVGNTATLPVTLRVIANQISINDATLAMPEGMPLPFILTRSGATTESLKVHLAVSTAAANSVDNDRLPTSATFEAGAAEVTLWVPTIPDGEDGTNALVRVTLLASPSGGYALGDDIEAQGRVVDASPPRLAVGETVLSGNHAIDGYAVVGTELTLRFLVVEILSAPPEVTLAGASVTASPINPDGSVVDPGDYPGGHTADAEGRYAWRAVHTLADGGPQGAVTFDIGVLTDEQGETVDPGEVTDDTLRIDTIAPGIDGAPSLASNNATNGGFAKVGDTITMTFRAAEMLTTKPTLSIAGTAVDAVNVVVDEETGDIYTVTHVLPDSVTDSADLAWRISNLRDRAGNIGEAAGNAPVIVDLTPPVIAAVAEQVAVRNVAFSFTPQATDANPDSLRWRAAGMPAGIAIHDTSGVISGVSTAATGTYPVTLTVTDGAGHQGMQTFDLVLIRPVTFNISLNATNPLAQPISQVREKIPPDFPDLVKFNLRIIGARPPQGNITLQVGLDTERSTATPGTPTLVGDFTGDVAPVTQFTFTPEQFDRHTPGFGEVDYRVGMTFAAEIVDDMIAEGNETLVFVFRNATAAEGALDLFDVTNGEATVTILDEPAPVDKPVVSVESLSIHSARVTWDRSAVPTAYAFDLTLTQEGASTVFSDIDAETYDLVNLEPGFDYTVTVRGKNDGGAGAESDAVMFNLKTLLKPREVTSVTGPSNVDITWNAPQNPDGTAIEVEYYEVIILQQDDSSGILTDTFTDTAGDFDNLLSLKDYTGGVKSAFRRISDSQLVFSPQTPFAFMTDGVPPLVDPVITAANATSSSEAEIIWTGAALNWAVTVTRDADGMQVPGENISINTAADPMTADITGLEADTLYSVSVTGMNPDETGNPATADFTTLLAAPQNLRLAENTATSLKFSWDTLPGASDYLLALTGANAPDPITVTATEFDFTGLSPGESYTLRLAARKSEVEGDDTSLTVATRLADFRVVNIAAIPGADNVRVTWGPPVSAVIVAGYQIEIADGDDNRMSADVTDTMHVFNGLSADTEFTGGIAARASDGKIGEITAFTFRTAIDDADFVVTDVSVTSEAVVETETTNLTLTWNAPISAREVSHYVVTLADTDGGNAMTADHVTGASHIFTDLPPRTDFTGTITAVDNNANRGAAVEFMHTSVAIPPVVLTQSARKLLAPDTDDPYPGFVKADDTLEIRIRFNKQLTAPLPTLSISGLAVESANIQSDSNELTAVHPAANLPEGAVTYAVGEVTLQEDDGAPVTLPAFDGAATGLTVDNVAPTFPPTALTLTAGVAGNFALPAADDDGTIVVHGFGGDVIPGVTVAGSELVGTPTTSGAYDNHVTATDAAGNQGRLDFTITVITGTPANFVAAPPSETETTLTWERLPAAESYAITVTPNGGDTETIPIPSPDTTSHTLSNLNPDTEYTVGIQAFNNQIGGGIAEVSFRTAQPIPTVSISGPVSPVEEGGDLVFTISRDVSAGVLKVMLSVTETGATLSGALPTHIKFIDGEADATLMLSTDDDDMDEMSGTVSVSLSVDAAYTLGEPSVADATVTDNDLPAVSVADAALVTEGDDLQFRVTRAGDASAPLSVRYQVADGAPRTGDASTGPHPNEFVDETDADVTIPANELSATIRVPTNTDDLDERNGNVTLTLLADSAYRIADAPGNAAVGVVFDLPTITIAGPASVSEAGVLTYTLTSDFPPRYILSPVVRIEPSGEVLSPEQALKFNPLIDHSLGHPSIATYTVRLEDDDIDEADGVLTVTIKPDPFDFYNLGVANSVVTAVTDDDLPAVTIAGAPSAVEGVDNHLAFSVTRHGNNARDVDPVITEDLTVSYTLTESGGDFIAQTEGELVIPANATTATLELPIEDDEFDEPAGEVVVKLTEMKIEGNYRLARENSALVMNTAAGTLADDDLPVITIADASASPMQEGANLSFVVTRVGDTNSPLSVPLSVTEDQSGDDALLGAVLPSTAAFAADKAVATVTVPSRMVEGNGPDSVVSVTLTPPAAAAVYRLGAQTVGTGVITDGGFALEVSVNPILDANVWTRSKSVSFSINKPETAALTYTEVDANAACDATAMGFLVAPFDADGNGEITFSLEGDNNKHLCLRGTNAGDADVYARSELIQRIDATAPTASAASPVTATVGREVTLSGVGDDAGSGVVAYLWTQHAGDAERVMSDVVTDRPVLTFTAPAVPAVLNFTLSVTDLVGLTGSTDVTVNVNPNANPVATASALQSTLQPGDTLTLNGSAADSDNTESDLQYFWTQVGGEPSVNLMLNFDAPRDVTFQVPNNFPVPADYSPELTFMLTVTDGEGGIGTDTVTITIQLPVVTINDAPAVTEGESLMFEVTRDIAPNPIAVNASISREDGTLVFGETAMAEGVLSAMLVVPTAQNDIDEAAGSVRAILKVGDGYRVGADNTAFGAINDDDLPVITIADASASPMQEGANLSFVATRVGDTNAPLSVPLSVTEDQSGDDALLGAVLPSTAEFAADKAVTTVTVPSRMVEGNGPDSVVSVALTPPAADADYRLGLQTVGAGVITDGDFALEVSISPIPDANVWTRSKSVSFSINKPETAALTYTEVDANAACDATATGFLAAPFDADGNGEITFSLEGDNNKHLCLRGANPGDADVYARSELIQRIDATAPTVSAASPVNAVANRQVTLAGVGDDGNGGGIAAYRWTQDASDGEQVLADADTGQAKLIFTAPAAPAVLNFTLTVTDFVGLTGSVDVTVNVNANANPVATASTLQSTVQPGDMVSLIGAATDSDNPASDLQYFWAQTGGAPGVDLLVNFLTPQNAAFQVPDNFPVPADYSPELTFTLSVFDGQGGVGTDTVTMTIQLPVISINDAPAVTEGGVLLFPVTRDIAPNPITLSARITREDGTLVIGGAEMEAGVLSTVFAVSTLQDDIDEPAGSVRVVLKTGNGYRVGDDDTAVGAVNDDDLPTISIAAVTATVVEGDTMMFAISRTDGDVSAALDVLVAVSQSGGANVLVNPGNAVLRIPANQTSATLQVPTQADANADGVTVTVALRPSGDYQDIAASAAGMVNDDPPPVAAAIAVPASVNSGEVVTLSAAGSSDNNNMIESYVWSQVSPPTPAIDFGGDNTADHAFSFTAPQVAQNTDFVFRVTVTDNFGGAGIADVTLRVLRINPTVSIADASPSPVEEGAPLEFVLTRNGNSAGELTVNLQVVVNVRGLLDEPFPSDITFPSGAPNVTLSLPSTDDVTREENANVTVTLLGGDNYNFGAKTRARGMVTDDNDPAANVVFNDAASVTEGEPLLFMFTRNPATAADPLTGIVAFTAGRDVLGDCADDDVDLNGADGVSGPAGFVRFFAGESSAVMRVCTDDDNVFEASTTVVVEGAQGLSGRAEGLVLDNDDTTAPMLDGAPLFVSSRGDNFAAQGDTLTLTFSVDDDLVNAPTVTIAGRAAPVVANGRTYTAALTLQDAETQGAAVYDIGAFEDAHGNTHNPAAVTSAIVIDSVAPSFNASIAPITGTLGAWLPERQLPNAVDMTAVTYSISGDLPRGLAFDPATRIISGVPASAVSATYAYVATDAAGNTAELSFSVEIIVTIASRTPGVCEAILGRDCSTADPEDLEDATDMLGDMTMLDVEDDGLSGETLDRDDFGGMTGLEELDLSDTDVSGLEPGTLDDLDSLEMLDLSGNENLDELPMGILKFVADTLETLILSDTGITELPEGLFDGAKEMNELRLPAEVGLTVQVPEPDHVTVDTPYFETRLRLPQAAPFDIWFQLTVTPDTANIKLGRHDGTRPTTTMIAVTILAGMRESEVFTVYQGAPVTLQAIVRVPGGQMLVAGDETDPERIVALEARTLFARPANAVQRVAVLHAVNIAAEQARSAMTWRFAGARSDNAVGGLTIDGNTFNWRDGGMANADFLTDAVETMCDVRGMQDGAREICEVRSFGDLLRNASFQYSPDVGGVKNLSVWGRGASHNFSGDLERGAGAGSTYHGGISGAHLGADYDIGGGRLLGVALSAHRGRISFKSPGDSEETKSDISLNGVLPYLNWSFDDGNFWMMLGASRGDIKVEGREAADLESRLFALGLHAPMREYAMLDVAWKMDANFIEVADESESEFDLSSSSWRMRHATELSAQQQCRCGKLTQRIEIGARADGGDLQKALSHRSIGGGVDLSFAVDYAGAIDFSFSANALLWHTTERLQEAGASLSIARTPRLDRGFQFALQPKWGDAAGGSTMWDRDANQVNAVADDLESFDWTPREMTMRFGYGVDARGGNALLTPFAEWSRTNARAHARFGVNLRASFKSLSALHLDMFVEQDQSDDNTLKLEGRLEF